MKQITILLLEDGDRIIPSNAGFVTLKSDAKQALFHADLSIEISKSGNWKIIKNRNPNDLSDVAEEISLAYVEGKI